MDIVVLLRAIADVAESNPKFLSAIQSAIQPDQPKLEKKHESIFQAAQWPIQASTLEWIQSRWPGVDYKGPLQGFIDYWGGTGKAKTAKNWELTLRKNPVFAAEMNTLAGGGADNDSARSRARDVYVRVLNGADIPITTPEARWLIEKGHCYAKGTVLRVGQSSAG